MGNNDKLSLDQYMTLRKLMADMQWYKRTGRIDELSVQVKKYTGRNVYLHCNDEKLIEKKVISDHKAAMSELMSSMSELSGISDDTLETIKVWSDMCFYIKNPRTFDLLCSSTFNEKISLQYGPLEFTSDAISEEEAMHGDAVRRMMYYPRIPCGEKGEDFLFMASMGSTIGDCYTAFKDGVPMDENDALLMYDLYANQHAEAAYERGEGGKPYEWESNRYKYYMGADFSEEEFADILDGGGKNSILKFEDTCLATHMSKLFCSKSFQPADIVEKNSFLRGVFDVVSQTGSLPAAIVNQSTKDSITRRTVRSHTNKYGVNEIIPLLDAAYFMSANRYDRKMFNMQRRVCDSFVIKKELEDSRRQLNGDMSFAADNSFGVVDIDEKDVPPDIDEWVK